MSQHALNRAMGQRVRALRRARGVTQGTLAKHIRLSRTQLTNLEAGRSAWSLWHIAQIAAALNTDLWRICHPQWQALLGIAGGEDGTEAGADPAGRSSHPPTGT